MPTVADERAATQVGVPELARSFNSRVHTKRKLPPVDHAFVEIKSTGVNSHIVNASDSVLQALLDRELEGFLRFLVCQRRQNLTNELHRPINEDTCRIPLRISNDLSSSRIRSGLRDSRQLHSALVYPDGVSIYPCKVDGMIP